SRDERSRRGGRPRDDTDSGEAKSADKKSDGAKAGQAVKENAKTATPADDAPPKDADDAAPKDAKTDQSGDQT
ncbi:MAG: hypothetical protein IIC08_04670, partial [Proteobacteria bacterium]|nr:hypothetical protein [Pseudomonadota bacterium]